MRQNKLAEVLWTEFLINPRISFGIDEEWNSYAFEIRDGDKKTVIVLTLAEMAKLREVLEKGTDVHIHVHEV